MEGLKNIAIKVEFSGGMELLFGKQKEMALEVKEGCSLEELI